MKEEEVYKGVKGWEALGFKTYSDYLNSTFWKEKRELILKEKGRKCEKCGEIKFLCVHHTNYINLGNESKDDLKVLCRRCHEIEHGKN